MSVIIDHNWEVTYGLSIDTDLDDLERRNSPYFAFFTNSIAMLSIVQFRHSGWR